MDSGSEFREYLRNKTIFAIFYIVFCRCVIPLTITVDDVKFSPETNIFARFRHDTIREHFDVFLVFGSERELSRFFGCFFFFGCYIFAVVLHF